MATLEEQIAAQDRTTTAVRAIGALLILGSVASLVGGLLTMAGWFSFSQSGWSSLEYWYHAPLGFLIFVGPVVGAIGWVAALITAVRLWKSSAVSI